MRWRVKVLAGPKKGEDYQIVAGITLGRSKAQLHLDDQNMSNLHARVMETESGDLILVDQGSKNGLIVSGERVSKVPVENGLQVELGSTILEFYKEDTVSSYTDASYTGSRSVPGEVTNFNRLLGDDDKNEPAEAIKNSIWESELKQLLEGQIINLKNKSSRVEALPKLLHLKIISGMQVGQEWILGYSPRRAGPASLDINLWEPQAPEVCFEIYLEKDSLIIKTEYPKQVKFNDQELQSKVIADGDTISINDTKISLSWV